MFLVIGEYTHGLPSRFIVYQIPRLCGSCTPPLGKDQNLQEFRQHAPRNSRSPHRRLKACPVPVSFRRVLIHNHGVRTIFRSFTLRLLKVIRSPLHLYRRVVEGPLQGIVVLQESASLPSLVWPVAEGRCPCGGSGDPLSLPKHFFQSISMFQTCFSFVRSIFTFVGKLFLHFFRSILSRLVKTASAEWKRLGSWEPETMPPCWKTQGSECTARPLWRPIAPRPVQVAPHTGTQLRRDPVAVAVVCDDVPKRLIHA